MMGIFVAALARRATRWVHSGLSLTSRASGFAPILLSAVSRMRRRLSGSFWAKIPIINYAPPSVWAWRPWRARAMRRYIDEVLAILPFEPAAFARLNGPHCTYVGHPLAERINELRPSAEELRRRNARPPIVLVLPGSRGSAIRRL